MHRQLSRHPVSISIIVRRIGVFSLIVLMTPLFLAAHAHAQNYLFTGGVDGSYPRAGITMDAAGNLYGTTFAGGLVLDDCPQSDWFVGCGTVYKLSARGQFSLLHSFRGGADGYAPWGRVTIGPDGALYGTTTAGGAGTGCSSSGCGTVFRLIPPTMPCPAVFCPWTEQIIHRFAQSEGGSPNGDVIFDQVGNLYGATELGSQDPAGCCGTVYKLSPSGGGWNFAIIHNFNGNDGASPYSGVTFDGAGNLYGTAWNGGANNSGVVYQLVPGSRWNINVLYNFGGPQDLYSYGPVGGVTLDAAGNIYGSTTWGTQTGGGVLWSLSAQTWQFSLLNSGNQCAGPYAQMAWGPDGNLYGTIACGPLWSGYGAVFELARNSGRWTYSLLYQFTGGSDGGYPESMVVFDSAGVMHGTTAQGGGGNCSGGCGVVWAMRP